MLLVNLWLGFPYMFLVCMGALQGIPEDVNEAGDDRRREPVADLPPHQAPAAAGDGGAAADRVVRVQLQQLQPDLHAHRTAVRASTTSSIPVGHTDILISMVYKVAFTGENRDYGLAAAFTILIFIVVAVISIVSFRTDQGPRGVELT